MPAEQLASELASSGQLPSTVQAYATHGYVNIIDDSRASGDVQPGLTYVQKEQAREAEQESLGSSSPHRHVQILTSENDFTEEKFELWRRYQHAVHGDAWSSLKENSFKSFLVDTPLKHESARSQHGTIGLGSFHQHYRVNGQLIAVGVVDILPNYVSSKYFFWEPEYRKLSLGTYSALKEAQLAYSEGIKYYCMGFYVPTSSKMRYKAKFEPSEILCPESLEWVPFHQCSSELDHKPTALKPTCPSQFNLPNEQHAELVHWQWLLIPSSGMLRLHELENALQQHPSNNRERLQQLRESIGTFVTHAGESIASTSAYVLPQSLTRPLSLQ